MSTSDLYILNKKSVTHLAEYRNGHGSAPVIWGYLGDKYIPEKPTYSMSEAHLDKVWALARSPLLEPHEQIVLMMTFDRAYVPLANLIDAGEACIKFGEISEDNVRSNHWVAIGKTMIEFASQKHNRFARGVCLSCTSVSDCWGYGSDWPAQAWSIFPE